MVCIPEIKRQEQAEYDKLSDTEKAELWEDEKSAVKTHAERVIRRVHEARENTLEGSKLVFK